MVDKLRGSVNKKCVQCEKEFSVHISVLSKGGGKGQCCSTVCASQYRLGKPRTVSKTRSDKKPRKSYVCKWCGKVFQEDRQRGNRQYCSNKCSGLSKRKNKKEHPRRKQAVKLQQWAKEVILRDKVCVRCGVKETLQAHHIKSYAKHHELRLDVDNGVALCPVCHHAQHPKHSLEWYLCRGGATVVRCVVCESPYLPSKRSQRSCSPKCGRELRVKTRGLGD